jgi:hypothetical protein
MLSFEVTDENGSRNAANRMPDISRNFKEFTKVRKDSKRTRIILFEIEICKMKQKIERIGILGKIMNYRQKFSVERKETASIANFEFITQKTHNCFEIIEPNPCMQF